MNKDLLFHYTSPDGAIGIIKNECLWATDIRFLNDSEEFIHGCKLVKEIAAKIKSGEIDHGFNENFLEYLLSAIDSLVDGRDSSVTAYVISFSGQNDSLNQWRAYSGDSGYALGWNIDMLRRLAKFRGAKLVKCIYEEDEQRKFVRRIIKLVAHKIKNMEDDMWKGCISSYVIKYILQRFMPRLKNIAFMDEQEWRIVITRDEPIKFRSGRLGITPYVDFPISNDAPKPEINNIFSKHENIYMPSIVTIGPCENQRLATIGIEQLFSGTGKLLFKKNLSTIPYRHMRK